MHWIYISIGNNWHLYDTEQVLLLHLFSSITTLQFPPIMFYTFVVFLGILWFCYCYKRLDTERLVDKLCRNPGKNSNLTKILILEGGMYRLENYSGSTIGFDYWNVFKGEKGAHQGNCGAGCHPFTQRYRYRQTVGPLPLRD